MAIVTGDRYLEFLVNFVEKQAGPLLEGTLILKLNPVGLHYVQSRLEALHELEGLLAGAPIDYLRAYISDLGDHRALEQLRRILRLLTSLKVVSVFPPPARDPTPLSLLPFGRLKILELRGCDLSTSAARGLLELRHTLEKIICYNSTDALRHVFASRIADIKASPLWNRLSFISCACNGLVLMDESLQLLPAVETLDLSRNRFAKVDNLRKCSKLRHLDLGFNHMRTIASFSEVASPIVKLVLRNNALTTLRGIENLKTVEGLDLSYNIISNFSEIEILASLPSLQSLWLEGNPICCATWYRPQVFGFFTHPEKLKLDEKGISTRESWKRQIILASRQKRPAGFGFYSPATDDAEGNGILNTKRKKLSRLACIEDEEQRRFICSESVDQESVSCDSELRSREENVISDGEIEIVGLMNRIEFMKKERSSLWLREFKQWMDQSTEDKVENRNFAGHTLSLGKENYMKNKKSHKHPGDSSRYVSDSVQASVDESSTNILESDNSFADTSIDFHTPQYFDSVSEAASEFLVVDNNREAGPVLKIGSVYLKQDQLNAYSHEELNCLPVKAKNSLLASQGGDVMDPKDDTTPLTAIDEIMESYSSSACPSSPPHYQEDILHRRHNLEEEFMQLSAESYSVASSDSYTSCSGDDICEFGTSLPEDDHMLDEEYLNRSMDDDLQIHLSNNNYYDKRHEDLHNRQNGRFSLDSNGDRVSGVGKLSKCDHAQPLYTNNNLADAGGDEIDHVMSHEADCFNKRKCKRRPRRRIISISEENSAVGNAELLCQKFDGTPEVCKTITEIGSRRQTGTNFQKVHKVIGKEQTWINEMKIPPVNGAGISLFTLESASILSETDEFIKNYFHANIADLGASETCLQYMRCDSIVKLESGYQERELAILLSSENKLYVLLMDMTSDGSGTISRVLGCHGLEDVKEVVVGIGLQVLSVHFEKDTPYLFITRNIEKSRGLLSLLQVCDSCPPSKKCSLKSLEQIQVELFEKHVCGGLKMSIFLYSMLLFWHNNSEEESWLSRSLFVIEGYMLVCIEDLMQFSSLPVDDALPSSYLSLDSCCSISNISEMVIDPWESRCITLTLDHVTSELFLPADLEKEQQIAAYEREKMCTGSLTWKLKWFSEDTLIKFVALLKAMHAGTTLSPFPVTCIS